MGATGLFQQHPIEVIFVALLGTLLVGWAFGAYWLTPWALKLFLGFTAGILFFLGAWRALLPRAPPVRVRLPGPPLSPTHQTLPAARPTPRCRPHRGPQFASSRAP